MAEVHWYKEDPDSGGYNIDFQIAPKKVKAAYGRHHVQELDHERDLLSPLHGQEAADAEEKLRAMLERAFLAGYNEGVLSQMGIELEQQGEQ